MAVKSINVIEDVTANGKRVIKYEETDAGPQTFLPGGRLIVAPRLPGIPDSIRKRCTTKELKKFDDDQEQFYKTFTLLLRGIA